MDCEVIQCDRNPKRARHILKQIALKAKAKLLNDYEGGAEWVVMWGCGGRMQQEIYKMHRGRGGKVLFLDMGYFGRNLGSIRSSFRVSINGNHPQDYLFMAESHNRLRGVVLQDKYDPRGHVLLCGLGDKSRHFYGYKKLEWEKAYLDKIREVYPTREVVYRSKPRHDEKIPGCTDGNQGTIDDWLNGACLCVTHHSNTTVDAARIGVPSVCVDGIGYGFYGSDVAAAEVKSKAEREDFLRKVSWFNWYPTEAEKLVQWIDRHNEKIR